MRVTHIPGPPPYETNTFLLIGNAGHAVVIDPAAPAEAYNTILKKEDAVLTHILLTHGHFDHVASVRTLAKTWQAKVYADPADCLGNHHYPVETRDCGYTDGGTIRVDELSFTSWHTPGHTRGSWVLLCGPLLFTGDTLFTGSIGRTDLPGGDVSAMRQSLRKLCTLPIPGATRVLPGHGDFSTWEQELQHNYYLRGLAE